MLFIGGKLRRRPNLSKADKSYMHLRTVKSLPSPAWLNYTLGSISTSPNSRGGGDQLLAPTLSPAATHQLPRDLLTSSAHLVPLYSDLASTLARPGSAFSAITRGIADTARISTLDRLMLSAAATAPLSALGLHTLKNSGVAGLEQASRGDQNSSSSPLQEKR